MVRGDTNQGGAFGRGVFERILCYIVNKALRTNLKTKSVLELRIALENLEDKIPVELKEIEFYAFNEKKIRPHFLSISQLLDSNFYTFFLIANMTARLESIENFSEKEIEILRLLSLSSGEKFLLNMYSVKKSNNDIVPK